MVLSGRITYCCELFGNADVCPLALFLILFCSADFALVTILLFNICDDADLDLVPRLSSVVVFVVLVSVLSCLFCFFFLIQSVIIPSSVGRLILWYPGCSGL